MSLIKIQIILFLLKVGTCTQLLLFLQRLKLNHMRAVSVENLREKSPERVLLAEQPAPAEGAIWPVLQRLCRYEMPETIPELADRALTNTGLLFGQSPGRRTRSPTQGGKVKTGQKERGIYHPKNLS